MSEHKKTAENLGPLFEKKDMMAAEDKKNSDTNAYDFVGAAQAPSAGSVDLRELWLVLRRNAQVIVGVILFSILLSIIFLAITTPRYTAEAVLQINVQKNNVVDIKSVMAGLTADESQIQSQLDVITSRSLAGRVVKALELDKDPEFNTAEKEGVFDWISGLLKKDAEISDEEKKDKASKVQSATITKVLKRLKVVKSPKSYTIIINFVSKSPEKSAKIANAFVEQYLQGQLSMKFDATQRANSWLTKKLAELQETVRQSELKEQEFREKNGLIETDGHTISDQQLSELNSQLIIARTERAQAEAKLHGGEEDASSDVLKSVLIQNLRSQETEVMRKKSDLSSQYGPKHPKMINVNSELSDLRDKIELEVRKIKSSMENDVKIARAREQSLQKSLDELQQKSNISTKAKIELDELKRQKDANKALYESFLARSKETAEGQGLEKSDAFIISSAEVPLEASYPLKLPVLLIALISGIFAGILVAFILEHLDNAVSSGKQVEDMTGLSAIGMIPELPKTPNIVGYLTKKPSSLFAEALRSVLTAVHFSNPDNKPKVILITSSVPKEGKSFFSMAFATLVANSGKKVLLIDGDLKRPTVAKTMKKDFKYGLSDLLTGAAKEEQVICHEKETGLDYIPSSPNTVNSHNLLGSNRMKEFLTKMRTQYDMIIIDTPPIMAISDCIVLANQADTTLFILRWQKTPRDIVKLAVKQLKSFNLNIAGVVMTRIDLDKQKRYGYGDKGYYYSNYAEYYSN